MRLTGLHGFRQRRKTESERQKEKGMTLLLETLPLLTNLSLLWYSKEVEMSQLSGGTLDLLQ